MRKVILAASVFAGVLTVLGSFASISSAAAANFVAPMLKHQSVAMKVTHRRYWYPGYYAYYPSYPAYPAYGPYYYAPPPPVAYAPPVVYYPGPRYYPGPAVYPPYGAVRYGRPYDSLYVGW